MNFDSILEVIGGSGRVQYIHVLLAFYAQFILSISIYGQMFMLGSKQFRCNIDGCDQNSTVYETSWMSKVIPKKLDQKIKFDGCQMFVKNSTFDGDSCSSDDYFTSEKVDCMPTIFKDDFRTLISDWNLTCDREYLLTLSMSIFMSGLLCGVYTFGLISDSFGRRISTLLAIVLQIISVTAVIFSLNIYMYTVFRFLIAASSIAILTSTYVLLTELVGTKNRYLMVIVAFGWNLAEYILVAIAYYVHNWQLLQGIISSFSVLLISYYWLITESPKWLISKRKFNEAKLVIKKISKIQKKEISSKLLELSEEQKSETGKQEVKYSPLDLFRSKSLRLRIILISIIWFFDSAIGYTLSLGSKNMPGSIYLNFIFIVSGNTIGIAICLFIIKYLPRKKSMIVGLTSLAIICLSNIIISPEKKLIIGLLGMLGGLILTIIFNITYVYTAELFPTTLRSSAVGTGSMISRVGGILAPIIVDTYTVWRPIPYIVMGTFGFIGAFIIFWLPETLNKPLPSTTEELENLKVEPCDKYTYNPCFDSNIIANKNSNTSDL